jgi:rhamnogalacturonan endolyase
VKLDRNGICMVDAGTGEIIWGHPYKTTHIHDQGMFGDFIAEIPGVEFYSAEQDGTGKWVYSAATGELVAEEDLGGLSPRALWWGASSTKAYIPGRTFGGRGGARGNAGDNLPARNPETKSGDRSLATRASAADTRETATFSAGPSAIMHYGQGKIGEFEGRIVAIADVIGDWREELIVSLPGELRIYTTTIPTSRRRGALMEDPLYRKDVALQAMGYLYPAQLSYHFR